MTSRVWACFGLRLSSPFDLPDLGDPLDADPSTADVTLTLGPLGPPPGTANPLPFGLWRDATRCGVEVPGVGRFEAREGREIVIDVLPGADPRVVRLFLLGTVMGAVMVQRDHLVLHGNAVRFGDACAVVLGHSGAGKSTLAAEFDRRGFDVLSDDVVPVDATGCAIPGYPRIKLWDDALAQLGVATHELERVREGHDKFQLPLRRRDVGPLPVRWIYVLERHAGSEMAVEPVRGAAIFGLLHEHTYRNELLQGPDAAVRHLEQCGRLVPETRVTRLHRPAATMTAAATADAILTDLDLSPALQEST